MLRTLLSQTYKMPPTKERFLGALLGVHAGDSFGAAHEFDSWHTIQKNFPPNGNIPRAITGGGPFRWSPGHATDDTDNTRAVLLAYGDAAAKAAADKEQHGTEPTDTFLSVSQTAGRHILQWYSGPWPGRPDLSRPKDVGGATAAGLTLFARAARQDPRKAGAGPGRCGNGSLMRCIPTALFARDHERLLQETTLISAITHNDWRCILACVAYNVMVRELVFSDATPDTAVSKALEVLGDPETSDTVVAALTVGDSAAAPDTSTYDANRAEVEAAIEKCRGPDFDVGVLANVGPQKAQLKDGEKALPLAGNGYVLESLSLAVGALLDTKRSWEDLIVDVVRVGRDTDTNGAIAGGLVAARDGLDAIPAEWRAKLQFRDEFTKLVDQIVGGEEREE